MNSSQSFDVESQSRPELINEGQTSQTMSRPSVGMRYGDMRSALQQAAMMRAQRKGAPGSDLAEQEPALSSASQANQHQSVATTDVSLENEEEEPDMEAAQNFDQLFGQQLNQLYQQRPQGDPNARWNTCLAEPTANWPSRKCNLYLHLIAMFLCLVQENPGCGIPLSFWIAVSFVFFIAEVLTQELRERMSESSYWNEQRTRKKWILGLIVGTKELSEYAWNIYGVTLYFSKEADGCSDQNQGFMILMALVLIMSALKLILLCVVFVILAIVCGGRCVKRRNERNASKDILRSISRIKYSALSIGQNETDEECSVCFSEFTDEDIVTKLDCNEKHVFHEQCISAWIQQGKNSCPICRAPINADIQF